MGWIAGLVSNAFLMIAGDLVTRFLVGAGVAVVTYVGVDTTITWMKNNSVIAFQGLPQEVVGMLALMKVGTCISMVFSAMAMRMAVTGMAAGASKSFVKK